MEGIYISVDYFADGAECKRDGWEMVGERVLHRSHRYAAKILNTFVKESKPSKQQSLFLFKESKNANPDVKGQIGHISNIHTR